MTLRFSNEACKLLTEPPAARYVAISREAAMILAKRLVSILGLLGVVWQECGENPAIFCYRIGWQVAEPLRGQWVAEDQPAPKEQSGSCSKPSGNSHTPSTMSAG